jgi:hypothetical protein
MPNKTVLLARGSNVRRRQRKFYSEYTIGLVINYKNVSIRRADKSIFLTNRWTSLRTTQSYPSQVVCGGGAFSGPDLDGGCLRVACLTRSHKMQMRCFERLSLSKSRKWWFAQVFETSQHWRKVWKTVRSENSVFKPRWLLAWMHRPFFTQE